MSVNFLSSLGMAAKEQGQEGNEERCSFCDAAKAEVNKLVAGRPGVFICNRCAELVHSLLHEGDSPSQPGSIARRRAWKKLREAMHALNAATEELYRQSPELWVGISGDPEPDES